MGTLVQAIGEGLSAIATLVGKVHTDIGWRRLNLEHLGLWGRCIYIQETCKGEWRIRRIHADGTQDASASNDAANAGRTAAAAWAARSNLTYM